jgi:protein arginine kinase
MPFSHWANKKQQEDVLLAAKEAIDATDYMKGSLFLKLKDLSNIDKEFLVERHLISHEFAKGTNHQAVSVSEREIVSIMVNEEDHLRIQAMQSGLNLLEAWKIIDKIDDEFGKKLIYAYSPSLGFLTACPTNVGTGMRASVMLHLPSLVMTKQIDKVLQSIAKLSLTTRGFYGEGTEASGNFFQISNQVSLGRSEEELIDNIERIIKQVIEYEQSTREELLSRSKEALEDRIWRAYGLLKGAHIITSRETIDLLSTIRLGIDLGLIKDISRETVSRLFIQTQPAHLQKIEEKVLTSNQRDVNRAELIRNMLKKN